MTYYDEFMDLYKKKSPDAVGKTDRLSQAEG